MTEFKLNDNVKIVVDFEIGERVCISGYGANLDGFHTIINFKKSIGRCESGIMVRLEGYNKWLDIYWLTKIK